MTKRSIDTQVEIVKGTSADAAKPASQADWPQISTILPNHDASCPVTTDALANAQHIVHFETAESLQFSAAELRWKTSDHEMTAEYVAFPLADDLFLIDAMPSPPDRRSFTFIWDRSLERVLVAEALFPTPTEAQTGVLERLATTGSQSAVRIHYRHGGIEGAIKAPYPKSAALVGQHWRYRYSNTHEYDHIYHSERFYSWFCREGPDKGLGDFEECDVFGIRENLYLVSWREKLLPCVGILVEDHKAMRTVGKICGANAYTGKIANARVGATILKPIL